MNIAGKLASCVSKLPSSRQSSKLSNELLNLLVKSDVKCTVKSMYSNNNRVAKWFDTSDIELRDQ